MGTWEELEKLPTYDRVRTAIFEDEEKKEKLQQVTSKDINFTQYVENQIFKTKNIPEDNEKFLEKIQARIDQAGVEIPTVEVRYENLTVKGTIRIGSRALPSLLNAVLDFIDNFLANFGVSPTTKQELVILDGVTGVLKPGRMTLLLGPPSSGKSTLLRILSGERDSTLEIRGNITYNGYKLDEFEPRRTAAFVSQEDLHQPELTVRETLNFSAQYQGIGSQYENIVSELLRKEKELEIKPDPEFDLFLKASAIKGVSHKLTTEYYIKMLGLDICSNTFIGDHLRKGISGGQKKRVTIGEMMVGPARVHFMDGISTGLDSSTTYQIVKCIGQLASIAKHTVLMSLLQPAPETYDLFDDIILLSGSQIIYHGPRHDVEPFFEGFGFKRPPRKAVADYLQEVISTRDQKRYWADKERPYSYISARQFAEGYKSSDAKRQMTQDLSTPIDRSESNKKALSFNKWSLPQRDLWKVSFKQELRLLQRTIIMEIFILFQLTFISTITSTMFLRTELHPNGFRDAQLYGGAFYIIVLYTTFTSYNEVMLTAQRFPYFTKFRELKFYPPWTWSLSLGLIKLSFGLMEALVFAGISYYAIGFAPDARRFFRLLLLLTSVVWMASAMFRMVGGFSKTKTVSTGAGGFIVTVICTLGGLTTARTDLRGWWIWGYWAFPMSWSQNAIFVNEFMASRWRHGPIWHETVGHRFNLWMGFLDRGYRYWLGFGAEIMYALLFNILFTLLITYLSPPLKSQPVVSKELLDEWEEQRTGLRQVDSVADDHQNDPLETMNSGSSTLQDSRRSRPERLPYASISASENNGNGKKGLTLPFDPYCITFKNINYSVDMPKEQKVEGVPGDRLQLLHDVTGAFQPGVLTALVGVTGAGKTTLMDVLAGRKTTGYIEGDIRINGFPKKQQTFTRIAAYCEQTDVHSPQVTVYEAVVFSAWLRLPRDVESKTKMDFVVDVLNLVDLTPFNKALVGLPGQSGLSPEQRKRLTMAVELVANPSIIFMDEPTTGLDARSAAIVMRAVRNTVDTGRTLVCTIHQPNIDIFESFDEMLLLKPGGYVTYAGPLGNNSQLVIDYFQNSAPVPRIQEGQNPAAWVLEVTSTGMETKLEVDFGVIYRNSSAFQDALQKVEQLSTSPPGTQDISFPTIFAQPFWSQVSTCLWRQHWTYWRSPGYNLSRFLLAVGFGILFGTVHWGIGKKLDNERSIHTLIGAIFVAQTFYGIISCELIQPVLGAERQVFYRERAAGIYSPIPYALSQCLIEIPYVLTASTIFHLLIYSMMRFPWEGGKFFWIFYFIFSSQLYATNVGLVSTALAPNIEFGSMFCIFIFEWNILFTGFPIPLPALPKWWKWAYWANPVAHTIYGPMAVLTGYRDDQFLTTVEGSVVSVKDYVDNMYHFKKSFLKLVGPVSAVYPLLFAVLYFICLKYVNWQKR